jgi:hypothetical protein
VLLELISSMTQDEEPMDSDVPDYGNAGTALTVFYISVVLLFGFGTIKVHLASGLRRLSCSGSGIAG